MLLKSLILLSALVIVANCDPRLRFIFYYGSTDFIETAEFSAINLADLHSHPAFQRNVKTVMFHYGVGQSVSSRPIFDIITSYLFNREYNFVVISYENNNVVSTDVS